MKKLILLDAYALIFRAYYAFIRNPRYNSKGFNTSAIFGFTNTLIDILDKENPSHIAVIFDPPGKTFRNDMYEEYKANRQETPEDIKSAVPYIKKIIDGFNIQCISIDNYEADDVIGTLAVKAEKSGFKVFMMTPDKDFTQLISENINILKPRKGGEKNQQVVDKKEIKQLYGISSPKQFIEILGLMGDSADNIPGCPGVGPKTAQKLIQKYHSIEGVYENIEDLRGRQKELLLQNKEQVYLSRKLATIITNVPINFEEKNFLTQSINELKLREIFKELEFVTIAKRIFNSVQKKNENLNQQASLFENIEESVQQQNVKPENLFSKKYDYFIMDTEALQNDLKADLCIQKRFAFFFFFHW